MIGLVVSARMCHIACNDLKGSILPGLVHFVTLARV